MEGTLNASDSSVESHFKVAETLRDKLLKELHNKQNRRDISLEEQKKLQREFVPMGSEQNFSSSVSGLLSLPKFVSLSDQNDIKQTLQASGLSTEEVENVLFCFDKNISSQSSYAEVHKLNSIMQKIDKRLNSLHSTSEESETFNGAVSLNRHDYEEECSLVTASAAADKLTKCLVKLKPQNKIYNEELSQQLHLLEKNLMHAVYKNDPLQDEDSQPKKKKKCNYNSNKNNSEVSSSLWDCIDAPINSKITARDTSTSNTNAPTNKSTCVVINTNSKSVDRKTDLSKPFVLVLESSQLIPIESIKENRLSVQEIKLSDKFKNYSVGDPTNKLYLKNLPHKVTDHELASIFGHFESPNGSNINYRILNGKMRGQAFITFKDVHHATRALETCNGFIFKNKPIVIAYGKMK